MKKFVITLVISFLMGQSIAQIADLKTSAIFDHLSKPENEFGLVPSDLNNAEITDDYTSHTSPINYVYLRQSVNNRPIFNATAVIAMIDDAVVLAKSKLVNHLAKRTWVDDEMVSSKQAFSSLAESSLQQINFKAIQFQEAEKYEISDARISEEPIKFELGYLFENGTSVLVWKINWYLKNQAHWYDAYVDASNGSVLRKEDWVLYCDWGCSEGHNHDFESHQALSMPEVQASAKTTSTNSYEVFAIPLESPNHGARSIVVDPADEDASPFGWHDINGVQGEEFTTTQGNNVRARDDRDANNAGGTLVDGGPNYEFKTDFDINQGANLFLPASTVNLFYMNNIMHDVWWHYGFDEPAGNFQENNYGNGGQASDFVNADAQDGSGSNNANFATPGDGQNPRMQMFLWQVSSGNSDFLQVNAPADIEGKYSSVQGGFGPRLGQTPIKGDLILADDGSAESSLGCNSSVVNMNGQIALIDRGECTFVKKIQNAQNAGAIGAIIINNVGGNPITMGGTGTGINIPSIMVTRNDGQTLKNRLSSSRVNVSLYDSSGQGASIFDSDFDNGIIAHEYGHGISIRLTGGPNSSCLSGQEQMGEGWSDFLTLVMTHEPGDAGSDRRGIGTYVRNQSTTGNGIRPYPYSTNTSTNPVTYDDIKQARFTVPHGVGSVWCSMLWDLYWSFIDVYGYDQDIYRGTGGNNMVMKLVVEGLKLQGCGPGFVDGRDAIIEADKLLYGGKNVNLIWETFAARGLGYSANQGTSSSKTDGTEAFDLPPNTGTYSIEKLAPKTVVSGDTISFLLKIFNTGFEKFEELVVKDTMSDEATYLDDDGKCPINANGQVLSITLANVKAGDSVICSYRAIVKEGIGGAILIDDDMEDGDGDWRSVTSTGLGSWERVNTRASSGQYSWYINDPEGESDRWLEADVDLTGLNEASLSFNHFYITEQNWDGAVIEIQNGTQWVDLGAAITKNGYDGPIEVNQASAISGRQAFTGNSGGFINTVVDLKDYLGEKRVIRYRFVSDALQGAEGWYIDDVSLFSQFQDVVNSVTISGGGLKPQFDRTFTTVLANNTKDTSGGGGDTTIVVVDSSETLRFFPNPVIGNNDLQVVFKSKSSKRYIVSLHDALGKDLWQGYIQSNRVQVIPMGNLASGSYMLKLTRFEEEIIERIIKIE